MASAYYDKTNDQWIASFRRPFSSKRRNLRLRIFGKKNKRAANKEAKRFDALIRQLEVAPNNSRVENAFKLKLITDREAKMFTGQFSAPEQDERTLTIKHAYESHPSTLKQSMEQSQQYGQYLNEFLSYTGLKYVQQIKLDIVLRYINHLRGMGYAYETRKHKMRSIKRAMSIGATEGIPNAIKGLAIDHEDNIQNDLELWTDEDLKEALALGDRKLNAIIAMGFCLGMRPSEISRAEWQDLDKIEDMDVLHVGQRQAKNKSSMRSLPIPPAVLNLILSIKPERCIEKSPIIYSEHRSRARRGMALQRDSLNKYFQNKSQRTFMSVKGLRKMFSTRALEAEIDPMRIETYMGHQISSLSPITNKSYLAKVHVKMFKSIYTWMNDFIEQTIDDKSSVHLQHSTNAIDD